ncbi:phage portal protein [uncultured Sulfitobacter sp.]|uniref:phage portal protein n=1 Tax=uncultured Sulfitobacter sp. TaxID=191468 RepID=UPI002591BDCC|nr:phage portal protein [uncultured Sulfitobacter sp.]
MRILDLFRRTPSQPPRVRRFDGAAGGRRGFGMGSFGRINPETAAAGPSLRSRAAYLAHNNPWVAQGVSNWVGALVGSGITPSARHTDPETRRELNAYFAAWCNRADAEGRTDFEGLQSTIARSLVVAGEGLAVLTDDETGEPRIRIIAPELLDESKTDGIHTFAGVETDEHGKRLTFHILPEHPTHAGQYQAPQRVAAENVLHVLQPLAPGQLRGASWLAPIILGASDFDQYCDALLMSAKVAAMHAGFIVDANGTGTDPYDNAEMPSMEPGSLVRLPFGQDVKFNSPAQLQQADAFLKHGLRQLAAGLGLPEHLVSGDLSGANYSSLRAGLLPFRQRVEQVQYGVLVPQFLAPIWRNVITYGIQAGDISAPDFETNPDLYLRADWLPPRPMQVDPLKDTQATVAEIEAGLTSRRKAVAERGWNLDDLDAELATETQRGTGNAE